MRLGALSSNDMVRLAGLLGVLVLLAALLAGPSTGEAQDGNDSPSAHVIPLFTPAGDVQQGFARIINHSRGSGTVRITGTDDAGRSRGPVTLSLNASETRHFNSDDLEAGNASKGLSGGLGDGQGNWRLRLESHLDLEVGAYIRTADGFLSSVHDVVRRAEVGGETVYHVPIFNPASNRNQVSKLRLVNLTPDRVDVTIRGRDDAGRAAPGSEVELTLPAGGAGQVSAQALEAGGAGFSGRLGDGAGKWQLFVSADGDIEVVSLMSTPTGHLTNLSVSGLRDTGVSESESPRAVGSTFRDCAGCPEMVVVPSGSYLMGSLENDPFGGPDESPAHLVTIGAPFAVGVHEVTFAQWDACYRAGGCSHRADDQGWGRGTRPVVDVSWDDAQEYVRWLSGETGRSYRLPSEAEWEYVASAGTGTRYWWGNASGDNRANCDRCGSPWDDRQTAPVGSFSPNAFGLHDVHGNVWERVQDCRNDSYVGAPSDGSAWETGNCNARGVRGGGWKSIPLVMRAANRAWVWPPSSRVFDAETGFRVARALAEPARHTLALFRPAGQTQQGFARVINRSNRAGTVRIWGTDDSGNRRGPVSLRLDAEATRHFNSEDLEGGNAAKGLSGSLGNGQGDWRLELESDLDLEPSAYIRTPDGFLTAMHAVARSAEVRGETVHQVPIFNPGSNRNQVSWLRLVNLTDARVGVTIEGRDDEGRAAPLGDVRLTLPANGARRISAQQLESGSADLAGRLGEGTGKWRLFVTADGAIEVVSLLQSPTGHLSNLSTVPRNVVESAGFEMVAEGASTVRPLQTIQLMAPGGLGDSDYTVLMDLSGTGAFDEDETIEVEGLTTDDERILFASPLTQMLPEANTSHRFAVRVRREADQGTSNVLRFSIDEIASVAGPPGFATMVFEAILKSIYASVDDPLLNLKAASIQPGLVTFSAARLGVDTTFSDVLAEATMQSLFGIPVTELAPGPDAPAPAADPGAEYAASQVPPASAGAGPGEGARLRICELADTSIVAGIVCGTIKRVLARAEKFDEEWGGKCDTGDVAGAVCLRERNKAWYQLSSRVLEEIPSAVNDSAQESIVNNFTGVVKTKLISKGWRKLSLFLRKLKGGGKTIQVVHDVTTVWKITKTSVEFGRVLNNDGETERSNSDRDFDDSGRMTKQGLQRNLETHKVNSQSWKQETDDLLPKAEKEIGAVPNLDDDARESFSVLVNDIDRQLREAETFDDLEGVYKEEQNPHDAIINDPDRGPVVAGTCEPGYREFPLEDGKTSTCVFESLVEENCYEGSRQPSDVDQGGSEACLYYSLDFFQPNGECRENYERVYFQGRWTCRWAELGPNQAAWYTLYKTQEEPPGSRRVTIEGITIPSSECVSGYEFLDASYLIPEEKERCIKHVRSQRFGCGILIFARTIECLGDPSTQEKRAQCRQHFDAELPKCG